MFKISTVQHEVHLFLSGLLMGKKASICIFASDGKLLLRKDLIVTQPEIKLAGFSPGRGEYFIKLIADGDVETKRVIW